MQNKQRFIIILVLLFLGVGGISLHFYNKSKVEKNKQNQEQIELELKEYINSEIDRQLREEKAKQELIKLENMNVYDKLKDGQEVSLLIVTNLNYEFENQSIQLNWYKNLQSELSKRYGSRVLLTLMPTSDNNIAWNWILLNEYYLDKEYDAVILTSDVSNQTELSLADYSRYYEAMLRDIKKVKKVTDVITLAMNPSESDEIIKRTKLISDSFIGNVEDVSGIESYIVQNEIEELNEETINAYYNHFTSKILKVINKNIQGRKLTLAEDRTEMYSDVEYDEAAQFLVAPISMDGFTKGNNSNLLSNTLNDSIEYEINGSRLFFTYQTSPKGGKYAVYINNDLIKEINTYNTKNSTNTVALQNLYEHPVKMKIVTTDVGEDEQSLISVFGLSEIQ